MILKNGLELTRRVKDSNGPRAYAFWIENSYFPPVYFVRGETFEDAYDWFLCDPRVEEELAIDEDYIADWIRNWHGPVKATWEDLASAYCDCDTWVTWTDNGKWVDAESVGGTWIGGQSE